MSRSHRTRSNPIKTLRTTPSSAQGSESHRPGLPLREWLVIVGLLLTVNSVVWLLGGHIWWAITIVYVVAGLTFIMLFIPLPKQHSPHRLPSPTGVQNLKRLLCFPVFWPGLALLIYVWIQSWNIAWVLTFHSGAFLLVAHEHIEWLPSGMQTILERANPFIYLMIFGSCFLWSCALWVGIQTRRGFMIVLNGFAVMFFLYAAVALVQYYLGFTAILGIWEITGQTAGRPRPFFGTLININHAGSLLILGSSVCMGLFFHYLAVSRRRMQSGGPWLVYLALMIFVGFTAVMTLSRAVIAMGVITALVFACLIMLDALLQRRWKAVGATALILLFTVGATAWLTWQALDRDEFAQEWQRIFDVIQDPKQEIRAELNTASLHMMRDRQPFGFGAGGFSWYFPAYQELHPKTILHTSVLRPDRDGRMRWQRVRVFWDYAHNDWIQYTIELGYAGVGIIASIFLAWIGIMLRWIRHFRLQHLALHCGLLLLLMQATVEFHLQIAAVHVAFAAAMALAVKWQSMPNFYKS